MVEMLMMEMLEKIIKVNGLSAVISLQKNQDNKCKEKQTNKQT